MVKVILIDTHDEVLVVDCADDAEAEAVGAAAIWSDGGVSAYLLPEGSVKASKALFEALRDGGRIDDVRKVADEQPA